MLLQVILLFALAGFILAIVAITKKPDPQVAKNEAQVAKNEAQVAKNEAQVAKNEAAIIELQKNNNDFNDKWTLMLKGVPNTIGLAQCKYGPASSGDASLATSAEIFCPGVKVTQGDHTVATSPSLKFEHQGGRGGISHGGWLACQDARNLNGQCTELAYAMGACAACPPVI